MKDKNSLLYYLKSHILRDINEMYEWHRSYQEKDPYWINLLNDIKEVIFILEEGKIK